jgi:homoserine dehydrogenase
MRFIRLSIVGLGVVGRWLSESIERRRVWLERECHVRILVVSAATHRGGFVHRPNGLDVPTLVSLAANGRSLAEHPGVRVWSSAIEGLAATEFDVLAEASNTNPREPEPALSHIRLALTRGAHVVTSSKGACAAAVVELMAAARDCGVQCRMESTVMSGTPVLSTIRDGLAGARVLGLRGILNGTANYVLTRMADGLTYGRALVEAQALGYAEPDPADDVDGHDIVAKIRVLAGVAFGRALSVEDVRCRGITSVSGDAVRAAVRDGKRVKMLAMVRARDAASPASIEASVGPVVLSTDDLLASVDGVLNALSIETDTTSPVLIVGPGAGRDQAGQGVFADLVAVLRGTSMGIGSGMG